MRLKSTKSALLSLFVFPFWFQLRVAFYPFVLRGERMWYYLYERVTDLGIRFFVVFVFEILRPHADKQLFFDKFPVTNVICTCR